MLDQFNFVKKYLSHSLMPSEGSRPGLSITCKTLPGRVAQSVTCLATDASLTADPGVASSIPYFRGD